ncbi:hypothetical protein TorRG33x02_216830 [Trema orientale]|uniref:Uncharacterized protein n=1 Tax=Trema orientale TaxID=63057 RepID=A0A2P5EAF7_TREOI|nr:hypothetical protein TorRG33x02_216830 [Trema orientale]
MERDFQKEEWRLVRDLRGSGWCRWARESGGVDWCGGSRGCGVLGTELSSGSSGGGLTGGCGSDSEATAWVPRFRGGPCDKEATVAWCDEAEDGLGEGDALEVHVHGVSERSKIAACDGPIEWRSSRRRMSGRVSACEDRRVISIGLEDRRLVFNGGLAFRREAERGGPLWPAVSVVDSARGLGEGAGLGS